MKKIYFLVFGLLLLFVSLTGLGQTVVTLGGEATITCPAISTATWTTPPTGVTFSNLIRGSGVTCVSASDGLNGSGFTSPDATTAQTVGLYYTDTIKALAGYDFTLSNIVWLSAVSTGTSDFAIQYSNNGGPITSFGSNIAASTNGGTFTGSVTVVAGTSIILYLIPYNVANPLYTVRVLNNSTFTVAAAPACTVPIDVSSAAGVAGNGQVAISWINSTCYNDVMIVASTSSTFTSPSGTAYVGNTAFGSGTALGSGYAVYRGSSSPQYISNLTNGTPYYFKIYARTGTNWSSGVLIGPITPVGTITNATDHFRSAPSTSITPGGAWNVPASWQSSPDGITWNTATLSPTTSAADITILSGDTIQITSAVSIDKTTVNSGGTLRLVNGLINGNTYSGAMAFVNGTADELTIQKDGTLQCISVSQAYGSIVSYASGGDINVAKGGRILIGDGTSNHGASSFYTFASTTAVPAQVIWNDSSILEWSTTNFVTLAGGTYFPSVAANVIPILRFSATPLGTLSAAAGYDIHGLLEVNSPANITWSNTPAGATFRNGIIGTGNINQSSGAAAFFFNGATAKLGGTGALNLIAGLFINSGCITTLISDKIINQGGVTVSGVLDAGTLVISNSALVPSFTVAATGTLRTSNVNGLKAISGSIDNTNSPTLTLSTGSTIEYYTTGAQNVSALTYSNLTINGAGAKTLQGAATVSSVLSLNTGTLNIGSNTLTLNGTISYGTGTISGSSTSNLTMGTTVSQNLYFTSGSQVLHNLTLIANAKAALMSPLDITAGASPGTDSIGAGTAALATNNFLTLKSDINGTARIAQHAGLTNPYITGNVTVERYIQSHRAWRLLTGPISTATPQAINAAWQEGQTNTATSGVGKSNTVLNYGTEITLNKANNLISGQNGYDFSVTDNPSILFLNPAGTAWTAPASTTGVNVNGQQGFMLFIRGDRSVTVTTPPFNSPTATTLRTSGSLNQGTKSITIPGSSFRVIGNPYASGINFTTIYNSNTTKTSNTYYLWDPLISSSAGVGAFVTFTSTATPGLYTSTTATSPFDLHGRIESGSAFVINFTATGTLSIPETAKIPGSALVFRPADQDIAGPSFRGDLYAVNADNTTDLEDGTLTLYDSQYSDSVSWLEDAKKLGNPAENISLERDGKLLAIEKRQPINVTDTIFFSITNMQPKTYQFRFTPENMAQPGLVGRLEDKFLGTSTPVSLTDINNINFTVTSNPASQGGSRFRVVFQTVNSGPLPVTFTSVKASQQNNNSIAVQWAVTNQLNINQYIVEKSTDGSTFTKISTTAITGTTQPIINYNWVDEKAVAGDNYYRVVSVSSNGTLSYSQVVKVRIGGLASIRVYPNPVKDGILGLQLTNMPKGIYGIRLHSTIGQELMKIQIAHNGGSSTEQVTISKSLAKGIYQLEIVKPDGDILTLNIECE